MTFQWYIVQARTNTEKLVAKELQTKIEQNQLENEFGEILVPSETVVDMKNGQKRQIERRFFPGYILIQIRTELENGIPRLSNEAWHLVKSIPKVTGFVGGTNEKPLPISENEANRILNRIEKIKKSDKPVLKNQFNKGDNVRVLEGPFADFNGVVDVMDVNKGTVRVLVLIFGRPTPVDFTSNQLEITQ